MKRIHRPALRGRLPHNPILRLPRPASGLPAGPRARQFDKNGLGEDLAIMRMLLPALACLFAAGLPAQDTNELLKRITAMEERVKALEAEVQTLRSHPAAAPFPPSAAAREQAAPAQPMALQAPAVQPRHGRRSPRGRQGLQPRY